MVYEFKKGVATPTLANALDRTKISDKNAVHVIALNSLFDCFI